MKWPGNTSWLVNLNLRKNQIIILQGPLNAGERFGKISKPHSPFLI